MIEGKLFSDLKPALDARLIEAVLSLGFSKCTPVQASAIPLLLSHKDVVVEAVTGSGKTLAYAVPIVQKLLDLSTTSKLSLAAVIMVPTRELAIQIHRVLSDLISALPSSSDSKTIPSPLLVTSGQVALKEQIALFRAANGPTVIVGTPGRLEEFLLGESSLPSHKQMKQKSVQYTPNLKTVELVILDEADRLLDLGFAPSLTKMLTALPKQRRTGLYSATMTDALMSDVVRVGMRNPVKVAVHVTSKKQTVGENDRNRTPLTLDNTYIVCKAEQKMLQLLRAIRFEARESAARKFIVYFSTCAAVDYFYQILSAYEGVKYMHIGSLHGQQPPSRRAATFDRFTNADLSQTSVLLCTDVAARGIDLPDVDCVIQFDPPQDPKAFSHRCGRTARAGRQGKAILLLNQGREEDYIDFIRLRKIPLSKQDYILSDLSTSSDIPHIDDGSAILTEDLRILVKTDRDLEDKAMKAFVSFIRSYSKHQASYIFRLQELDLIGVAKTYGLLRLPKMPEFADVDKTGWVDAAVDWNGFAYVDATKEAKRRETLSQMAVSKKARTRPKQTEAWSDKKQKVAAKLSKKRPLADNTHVPAKEIETNENEVVALEAEIREDERETKRNKREQAHRQIMGDFDL